MFLYLAHTRLEVYKQSYALSIEAYTITKLLPDSERYNLISQIQRASLSVYLNIAEGCSRRSNKERKRYFEMARGSLIEIDSALDIAVGLQFLKKDQIEIIGEMIVKTFKLLSGLIGKFNLLTTPP